MDPPSTITGIVDVLRDRAGVETVFGDPIERGGRTVVPVARVSYGFGGGWGSGGHEGESETASDSEVDVETVGTPDFDGEVGEGGGFGGGLMAHPVGALEITDDGTRFVRFSNRRRAVGALLVGLALGLLLGGGGDDAEAK